MEVTNTGGAVGPRPEYRSRRQTSLRTAGLILQSPFTSTFRVFTHIAILPIDKFPNYKNIGNVHCPVLIIHGTVDSVIPVWHGKELYELANEPKSFLWVNGVNHNDVEKVAGETYIKMLQAFAASLPQ